MIIQALVSQLNQRFQHEKRARVCLWFDEKREFQRLLPAFRAHLDAMKTSPFQMLEYDPSADHGQIWLKHRVHAELAKTDAKQSAKHRFVIYLPLSEDRLDTPDEQGEHHVELLTEYRVAGVLWRVGGKRPSLFTFLRQAGVKLPANPADQRKLYDGGADSLLAKYVQKFADRPAVHWSQLLTPELAQSRLLGDVDRTLLDLAVAPDSTWESLREKGLESELLEAVEERYGYTHSTDSPADWIENFVAVMALTETYLGYGEPADFPFSDRLPPPPLRAHHPELLVRWLRDSEGRPAWDRWVREVEKSIDLAAWVSSRDGVSHGFPHLVSRRWESFLEEFEGAAPKSSTTEAFFDEHQDRIKEEAEFSKASDRPPGAWSLMLSLLEFAGSCRHAVHVVCGANAAGELARAYIDNAGMVDRWHLKIRRDADEHQLPLVAAVADRHYASYTNGLNGKFFKELANQSSADIDGLPRITEKLADAFWNSTGRRALVIIDALRYDCAIDVQEALRGQEVDLSAARAELPTITPVGMTALMPLGAAEIKLEVKGNAIHPIVGGADCAQRAKRIAFMSGFGADCRGFDDIESESNAPNDLGELLVIVGHDEVDKIGHGSGDNLARHVAIETQRVARLVRKLHRWGFEEVHVVTDHGFVLLEESKLPEEVACEKGWCHVLKERYALVSASADIPLATFPFAWDPDVRVAVPPGLAFFRAAKSFSHGGAALQEIVIPHLVSRSHAHEEKRVGVEVVLPAFELMQTAVKVVLRPKASESKPGQMALFIEKGRTLRFQVWRTSEGGQPESVLPTGKVKEMRLEAGDTEKSITLFFHTAMSFKKGDLLDLDIRDIDTTEQFPPGGIKLTVGRDM